MEKTWKKIADWMVNHYSITTLDVLSEDDNSLLFDMICSFFKQELKNLSEEDKAEMKDYIFSEYNNQYQDQELYSILDNIEYAQSISK